MKHEGFTPGPWRYTTDGRVFGCCAHEWNKGLNMMTEPFVAATTENQANAALIASAPDLLAENERLRALLTRLVGEYESRSDGRYHYQMFPGDLAEIRAALAEKVTP